MKRFDMKKAYIAIGTVATLGAALAACSGGGGSSTTPATPGAGAPQAIPTAFGQNNFTGKSGTMSVSIVIPARGARASAAVLAHIHAQFGPKHADAHIRSMANTAPSSVVRAMGAKINYAGTLTESSRRGAQYVSPGTAYMEVVVTNAANTQWLVDDTVSCSASGGTCNSGNLSVPVGSNYNVSLFLYDGYCGYLLSAGTTSGVTVTASASPVPIAITLNPVVDYFEVDTDANTPFINDASEAQSFHVSVLPLDADGYYETNPGVLIDGPSFKPITQVQIQLQGSPPPTDISPATIQTVNVPVLASPSPSPVPYVLPTVLYSFAGTGGDGTFDYAATAVLGATPIVPSVAYGPGYSGYRAYTEYGQSDSYTPLSVQLIFTNPEGFPNPEGSPGYFPPGNPPDGPYAPSPQPSGQNNNFWDPQFLQVSNNTWAFEFPNLNNGAGSGYLGIQEIAQAPSSPFPIPFGGTINFTDNGSCSGVFSYPSPGPVSYSSPDPVYGLIIQGSAFNLIAPTNSCQVTATDSSSYSRKAYFNVYYDSSTLTIQSHARGTK
jgi:hypothetical protein